MKIEVNEKVHLSPIREDDKRAFVEYLNDEETSKRLLYPPFPYLAKHADEFVAKVAAKTEREGQPVVWAIRDVDDRLIGACGFDDLEIGKSHRAEIGYWLARPFWGQGIMPAVVTKLCEHAFADLGVVKGCGPHLRV